MPRVFIQIYEECTREEATRDGYVTCVSVYSDKAFTGFGYRDDEYFSKSDHQCFAKEVSAHIIGNPMDHSSDVTPIEAVPPVDPVQDTYPDTEDDIWF